MDAIVLTEPGDVASALEHPSLEPPRLDGGGATLALRSAMARFSSSAEHGERRAAVTGAIERLDVARAGAVAARRTADLLDGRPIDVMASIARRVPTETLATLLGTEATDEIDGIDGIVGDVEAVVRVIGRSEAPTSEADAATQRLHDRYHDHPFGWAPVASILYQGFDATMWLIAVTLHARATGERAAAPVPRTRRVAHRDSITGGVALRQGADVVLEIGVAGMPYGAGPHRCPGTELAEQITAGVVGAIESAGYRVDLAGVAIDADGRPTTLPIVVGQ